MEESEIIDISNKGWWTTITYNYLQENLHERLIYLDLTSNHISIESSELLRNFLIKKGKKLRGLSLIQTHLTKSSANKIFSIIGDLNLIELYLDNNILLNESIFILSNSLLKGPPLEVLSLNGCNITSEGSISLFQSLPKLINLKHFRFESNSMFDSGAEILSQILNQTNITHLSISDNQIWLSGINLILESILNYKKIQSLDLSYNALNLELLSNLLINLTNLTELCISGCKINDLHLYNFLDSLSKSFLKILILDGLNFYQLPISWPKIQDTIFSNSKQNFDLLLNFIKKSKFIQDLRLGFLELEQIDLIHQFFIENHIEKTLTLSLHDFGRTSNCWVINFPDYTFLSPTSIFEWKSIINNLENSKQFGLIFSQTLFEDQPLNSLKISGCELTNILSSNILDNFLNINLNLLDFSNNPLGESFINSLINFLKNSTIKELNIEKTNIKDIEIIPLFNFFLNTSNIILPKIINFSFLSDDKNELSIHDLFIELGLLLNNNCSIETLIISGPITGKDVKILIDNLLKNNKLKELNLKSTHINNYSSPDPIIDEEIQKTFIELTDSLYNLICKKNSKSNLKSFLFPLFTEIFIYNELILNKWNEIENKLNI